MEYIVAETEPKNLLTFFDGYPCHVYIGVVKGQLNVFEIRHDIASVGELLSIAWIHQFQ